MIISKLLEKLESWMRNIKLLSKPLDRIENWLIKILTKESAPPDFPLNNYSALIKKIKPADVVLVEGRSRVADVIRFITQTQWSHAAIFVGAIEDVMSKEANELMQANGARPGVQYVIESLMGQGMILTPIASYAKDNLRICRAKGLTEEDTSLVLLHVLKQLGREYDIRQLLDLARFMFPFYGLIPRRWRSSLFRHNAGEPTRAVCSTAVAEAFMSVHFPILPIVSEHNDGKLRLHKRNPKLFVPRDFDYSPYFAIVKVPFVEFPTSRFNFIKTKGAYRNLPWEDADSLFCNDNDECFRAIPLEDKEDAANEEATK